MAIALAIILPLSAGGIGAALILHAESKLEERSK